MLKLQEGAVMLHVSDPLCERAPANSHTAPSAHMMERRHAANASFQKAEHVRVGDLQYSRGLLDSKNLLWIVECDRLSFLF